MQKEALLIERMMMVVLVGTVVWQRYRRTIKGWWTNWRAKPKRPWTLQPRTPDDCQDCPGGRGSGTETQPGASTMVGSEEPAGTTEGT